MIFKSINPATGKELQSWSRDSDEDIERVLQQAENAYTDWSHRSFDEKAGFLTKLSLALNENAEKLALLATREMGKPISQSLDEVRKCANLCDHYRLHGEADLRHKTVEMTGRQGEIHYQPLGPVFSITPWNYPYWQVLRFAIPLITLGNSVVLKHAPNVIGCAEALVNIFKSAGAPAGLFQHVIADHDQAARIIADGRIVGVGLTGSERAGSAVATIAGRALKKCVLELGGSDPFIVCEDANIEQAAKAAVLSRFSNAGQVCIAAKRILVHQNVYTDFFQAFETQVKLLKFGDPEQEETIVGPMARADLREELHKQVIDSQRIGAKSICGGHIPNGPGYFYPPTILTDIPSDAPVLCQETFGPVAALVKFDDIDQAVTISNNSAYGLSASIWTEDKERGRQLALRIASGSVFINSASYSDPRMPIGGIKKSGFGRELAQYGMREFSNVKSIVTLSGEEDEKA